MGQLTYTTQEVQDRLDAVGTLVRPNLLDNSYFVGGGFQQGGGQFPINQRGATSYTSGGAYTVDRWVNGNGGTVTIYSDGIGFLGNNQNFEQPIDKSVSDAIKGKPVTMSILLANNTLCTGTAVWPTTPSSGDNYVTFFDANGVALIAGAFANGYCRYYIQSHTANELRIIAAKLEIGDNQTLAHQENGVWVLNEIPNYQQELAKCHRYLLNLNSQNGAYVTIGYAFVDSTTSVSVLVTTPTTMRQYPAITISGNVNFVYGGGSAIAQNPTTSGLNMGAGNVAFKINGFTGLTVGACGYIYMVPSDYILLSADL